MMRNMISWSRAFYKGFVILLWTVLWVIVGFLILSFAISSFLAGVLASIEDPMQIVSNPQLISQIVAEYAWPIMLVTVIVSVIIAVAIYATLVKVIGNTVLDEIRRTSPLQTLPVPPPPPPTEPEKR